MRCECLRYASNKKVVLVVEVDEWMNLLGVRAFVLVFVP